MMKVLLITLFAITIGPIAAQHRARALGQE